MDGKEQSEMPGLGDGLSDLMARLSLRQRATLGAMANGNFGVGSIEMEDEEASNTVTSTSTTTVQASNVKDEEQDPTEATQAATNEQSQTNTTNDPGEVEKDGEQSGAPTTKQSATDPSDDTSTNNHPGPSSTSTSTIQTQSSPLFDFHAYSATDQWRFKQLANLNGCRRLIGRALRQAGAQGPIMSVKLSRLDQASNVLGRISVQEVYDVVENQSCLVQPGGVRELSVRVVEE